MTWTPDPAAFVRDLEAKPVALRELASLLAEDPWREVERGDRVVFTGVGSSRFAALPIAAMLRAAGRDAVAERSSAASVVPAGPGTLAIGISASGSTPETIEALARHRETGSTTVAITNAGASALESAADHHIAVHAGEETGGVACRTFQHTIALLLASSMHLAQPPLPGVPPTRPRTSSTVERHGCRTRSARSATDRSSASRPRNGSAPPNRAR